MGANVLNEESRSFVNLANRSSRSFTKIPSRPSQIPLILEIKSPESTIDAIWLGFVLYEGFLKGGIVILEPSIRANASFKSPETV